MGSCVDNTRILTVLTQMVEEGGLGDDIDQVPALGIAPEWMSEKALSIATYCVASGAYVMMGGSNPVGGKGDKVPHSVEVAEYMSSGWEEIYGGKLEFVDDPQEMIRRALDHIDKKRAALGLPEYDPSQFGKSGDDRLREIESLSFEERQAALYGQSDAG
jgi:carbon-monoxide dehydrogenase catalytic subunit